MREMGKLYKCLHVTQRDLIARHAGDCSIYALDCDICDCGEFRRIMPDIDMVDTETMKALLHHQAQIDNLSRRQ